MPSSLGLGRFEGTSEFTLYWGFWNMPFCMATLFGLNMEPSNPFAPIHCSFIVLRAWKWR